ncbi:hypothetical protein CBR_g25875 [Chara braunii]|uniref:Methyltransferase FkbM domain-containing protein n=1 Tax=Chara braunii TaxID=69332 RepID=A0A388L6N6_CHABU|nr:hypothetical protein CBR_g25875 [Chara braunii]|eukprot:GBG77944.1 hypothetical protein CBR_g25875 [Chara braunii]
MDAHDLQRMISAPHDCCAHGRRYFFKGGWRNQNELENLMNEERGKRPPVCVVGCFANEVPCLKKEPCLLQFFLRPGTSDIRVLAQLYEESEYSFVSEYNLKTILDGGGNVGLASLIFANFVNEPGLGNEWGTMVQQSKEGVPAMTVDVIQDLFNVAHFDFAKIDIEGAEKEVFTPSETNTMEWLTAVPLVSVEMHDWMKAGSSQPVMKVFDTGLDTFRSGCNSSQIRRGSPSVSTMLLRSICYQLQVGREEEEEGRGGGMRRREAEEEGRGGGRRREEEGRGGEWDEQ